MHGGDEVGAEVAEEGAGQSAGAGETLTFLSLVDDHADGYGDDGYLDRQKSPVLKHIKGGGVRVMCGGDITLKKYPDDYAMVEITIPKQL